jgi:predicted carbohydrate-binding protein with CBM5 and CBM33 domain
MTAVRRIAALVVASGLAALAGVVPAQPVLAHGATTDPISRTAACTPGNKASASDACKAASAANGRPFGNFDNLRVPGVAGKDKQFIPDGNLCSGDLPEFSGLDLARDDWPAGKVTAGQKIDISYAATIPHKGKFRVYLTKQGYDPKRPLGWGDLSAEPIFAVTDPPLTSGSYRFGGKLPVDRSGRHVLYIVWQTTSTPDTYYSCSDLLVTAVKKEPAPATAKAAPVKPLASRSPEPGAVVQPADAAGPGVPPAKESWLTRAGDDRVAVGEQIVSTAVIVLVGVAIAMAVLQLRRRRGTQGVPRRFEKR